MSAENERFELGSWGVNAAQLGEAYMIRTKDLYFQSQERIHQRHLDSEKGLGDCPCDYCRDLSFAAKE